MSPQFQKSTRPLRPRSIRAAVRRFRQLSDVIDRYADPKTTQEEQQLTRAISGLAYAAKALSARSRRAAEGGPSKQGRAAVQREADG